MHSPSPLPVCLVSQAGERGEGSGGRRSGYGVEPGALAARRRAVADKLERRERRLARPDAFSGSRRLGRHALQLERALTQGRRPAPSLVSAARMDDSRADSALLEVLSQERRGPTAARMDDSRPDSALLEVLSQERRGPTAARTEDTVGGGSVEMGPRSLEGDVAEITGTRSLEGDDTEITRSRSLSVDTEVTGPRTLGGDAESIPEDVIRRQRLSTEQIRQIPRFHDYDPGNPCKVTKLHIIC